MKFVILVGDGMGDYRLPELDNRSPLEFADIPAIRKAAFAGETHLVTTIPPGMAPGSDVANLSMMGFNPAEWYTGRAPIEAAGAGIPMSDDDVAFRCNLVTVENELIKDHSAGDIRTEEAIPVIETLNRAFETPEMKFYPGTGYRHLLIWKNGPGDAVTVPPHDVLGQPASANMPSGDRAPEISRLMNKSRKLLADHPSNLTPSGKPLNRVTQIWLWGQGRKTCLPFYSRTYGLSGGVISAVDLVRGIGRLAGLEPVRVPGATGFLDTNYEGKVEAALNILKTHDFVFVHVEAPDECGHRGDPKLKIEAIEAFDSRIVAPVWKSLQDSGNPFTMIIGTDHMTPVSSRCHTSEPVPMTVVKGPVESTGGESRFDEFIDNGKPYSSAFEWIHSVFSGDAGARKSDFPGR